MIFLRRNLEWVLFSAIVLVGTLLLIWSLIAQWGGIVDRHELRQRGQLSTVARAVHAVFNSQEIVLTLLGEQLNAHYSIGQVQAIDGIVEGMLDINVSTMGYGMLGLDGKVRMFRMREPLASSPELQQQLIEAANCSRIGEDLAMQVGRPLKPEGAPYWLVPMCQAIDDLDGEVQSYMIGAIAHSENEGFFDDIAVLGPTNIVMVMNEPDLDPILWASWQDYSTDALARRVPVETYEQAIASAEERSGQSFAEIRASGEAYAYRLDGGDGSQLGMAIHDDRYKFWVLTHTSRSELMAELWRIGSIYFAIYLSVLLGLAAVLLIISRAEHRRRSDLVYQARHDLLTGLPNRQSMLSDFAAMRRKYGQNMSLLFIDMDNFKGINDGFGHAFGDLLLHEVGQRLLTVVNDTERLARVGGDEFVALVPGTDVQQLMARATELDAALARPYMINGLRFEIGCSIGVARMIDAGTTLNDALRAGDVAMYLAKRQRNTACLFEPSMGRDYLENIRIEQNLRAAIKSGQINLVYQPLVNAEEEIIGVEALARWTDAELGAIPPMKFISVAERAGLIGRLGEYIIERSLRDAKQIERLVGRPLELSLNASPRQFQNAAFARNLIQRVQRAGLKQIRPVLEITESLFAENQESIRKDLSLLREAGIRVSLDDFGTGYSSLALLFTLPIDELKIDKRFIDQIGTSAGARALVRGIVTIARQHGLHIVAEGVESREEFELLRAAGCDTFQGYLFGRPMPLDELLAQLAEAA